MVVDSSAVLAILFNEPERNLFSDALAAGRVRLMSSVNVLETAVVVEMPFIAPVTCAVVQPC